MTKNKMRKKSRTTTTTKSRKQRSCCCCHYRRRRCCHCRCWWRWPRRADSRRRPVCSAGRHRHRHRLCRPSHNRCPRPRRRRLGHHLHRCRSPGGRGRRAEQQHEQQLQRGSFVVDLWPGAVRAGVRAAQARARGATARRSSSSPAICAAHASICMHMHSNATQRMDMPHIDKKNNGIGQKTKETGKKTKHTHNHPSATIK